MASEQEALAKWAANARARMESARVRRWAVVVGLVFPLAFGVVVG
jgi:hypothetical protein